MLHDKIKELRDRSGYSQSELSKRLEVTRSSVNAWELGLSTPTTQYVVALAKLFHVSADYILEIEKNDSLNLSGYTRDEISLIYQLIRYIDSKK